MDATNLRLQAMHDRIDAASHRIDQRTSEMLSLLEDEMADGEYEAIRRAAGVRGQCFEADDCW